MKHSKSAGAVETLLTILSLVTILVGTALGLGGLNKFESIRSKAQEATTITCVSQSSSGSCNAVIKDFSIKHSIGRGENDYVFAGSLCFDTDTIPSSARSFIEFKAADQVMGRTTQIITVPAQARCTGRGIRFSMLVRSYPGSCPDVHAIAGLIKNSSGQSTTILQSEYSVRGSDICTIPTPTPSTRPTPTLRPSPTNTPTGGPAQSPTPILPTLKIAPTQTPSPVPTGTTQPVCKLYTYSQIADKEGKPLQLTNPALWKYRNSNNTVDTFKNGYRTDMYHIDDLAAPNSPYRVGSKINWTLLPDNTEPGYKLAGNNVRVCNYPDGKIDTSQNSNCLNNKDYTLTGENSLTTSPINIDCNTKVIVGWWYDKVPTGSAVVRADIATGNPAELFLFDTRWFDAGATPLTGSITLIRTTDGLQKTYPISQKNGVLNETISGIPTGDYTFSINLPEGLFRTYIDEVDSSYYDKNGIKRYKWKKDYAYKREPQIFNEKGSAISVATITSQDTPTLRVLYNTNSQVQYLDSRKSCDGCNGSTLGIINNWIAGDIACVPDFKKNDNEDPIRQPKDLKACVDKGLPTGAGCFCYNADSCRGIGGSPVGGKNENYCSVVGDVLCSVKGGECSSDQKVPNFCCNTDSDCLTGSACTGNEPNKNVCQSGKKCLSRGANTPPVPPGSSGQKVAGRGEIAISTPKRYQAQFSLQGVLAPDEGDLLRFSYEIKLPINRVVTQLQILNLVDRNGQSYDLREDREPLTPLRILPNGREVGWAAKIPPFIFNIENIIFSKISIPDGQDARDFIDHGELWYQWYEDDGLHHSEGEGTTPLKKNYQSGEVNERFEWWINKPEAEWPEYLQKILSTCKSDYASCKSCRGSACHSKDLPWSCSQLPQGCLDWIREIKDKVIEAYDKSIDSTNQKYEAIFKQPCTNAGLTLIPQTKVSKIFSSIKGLPVSFDPEKLKSVYHDAINSELEANVKSPLTAISVSNFPLDPSEINSQTLAGGLTETGNLKRARVLVANSLKLGKLSAALKKINVIDFITNIIKNFTQCNSKIKELVPALAEFETLLREIYYGDSMEGLLALSNEGGAQSVKGVTLKICDVTVQKCDTKQVDVAIAVGQNISQPFYFTKEEVSFPVTLAHKYTLSCTIKYEDETVRDCSDTFSLTTEESGIIAINLVQQPAPTITEGETPQSKKQKSPDLNSDGAVNTFDYAILIQYYGQDGVTIADLNSDDIVNSLDLSVLLDRMIQND